MKSETVQLTLCQAGQGVAGCLGNTTELCNPPSLTRATGVNSVVLPNGGQGGVPLGNMVRGRIDAILYDRVLKMIEAAGQASRRHKRKLKNLRDNYLLRAIWQLKIVGYVEKHPWEFSRYQRTTKRKDRISFDRDLFCGHVIGSHVDIKRTSESDSVVFAKVANCGANWVCPVCASKIHAVRADEVQHFVDFIHKNNEMIEKQFGSPYYKRARKIVMMTLTASHTSDMLLDEFGPRISEALRKLQNSKVFKRLARENGLYLDDECKIKGYIRASEYTHSYKNGWHKHFHALLTLYADVDVGSIEEELKQVWVNSCLAAGICADDEQSKHNLHEHGLRLDDAQTGAKAVADYVAKSGGGNYAVMEIACASNKKGRFVPGETARDLEHRTPNQIALDMVLYDNDLASVSRDRHTLAEYMYHTNGTAQLYWAKGLKALCGVGELSDEAAVDKHTEDATAICGLTVPHWHIVCKRIDQKALKEAAKNGIYGVKDYFDTIDIDYELPSLLTRDEVDLLTKFENETDDQLTEAESNSAMAILAQLAEYAEQSPKTFQGGCSYKKPLPMNNKKSID